ncbi:hypothetical protein [Streptomyces ziwulingensis]|uniref:Uncharacterized protein n=1 Tax=Streptomyces ziwulingensis TaxID=1045501 RepID=A0ABP9B9K6_9ACTN
MVPEQVVRSALAWHSPLDVPAGDVARVGLLLAGVARVVADEVRAQADGFLRTTPAGCSPS